MQSAINNIMQKFDFKGRSGSLQYWGPSLSVHNEMVLTVTGLYRSNKNHQGLQNYRERCRKYELIMGPGTQVDQEMFASVAAQLCISDERTCQSRDQIMGQLVMPVFSNSGDNEVFQGVIEFVTTFAKRSYAKEFNQIHNLLMGENLTTKPMGKMTKVTYRDDIIKFPLPRTSGITHLWGEITRRFNRVNQIDFQIMYIGLNGNNFPILSDNCLQACIADSSSNGMMAIRMFIERVA